MMLITACRYRQTGRRTQGRTSEDYEDPQAPSRTCRSDKAVLPQASLRRSSDRTYPCLLRRTHMSSRYLPPASVNRIPGRIYLLRSLSMSISKRLPVPARASLRRIRGRICPLPLLRTSISMSLPQVLRVQMLPAAVRPYCKGSEQLRIRLVRPFRPCPFP